MSTLPTAVPSATLKRYEVVLVVTVLSATTSVKSRIMALPGACLPTSGSHAQGARDASSFSTRDIFRFLGSGACLYL